MTKDFLTRRDDRIVNILGNALRFQATRVTCVIRIVVYISFVIWVME